MGRIALSVCVLCVLSGCFLSHDREPPPSAPARQPQAEPLDDPRRTPPPPGLPRVDPVDEPAQPDVEVCAVHTYAPLPHSTPIDIIWSVDSSQSMTDERQRVSETINRFVQDVEARDANVHVVMITATDTVPAPLGEDPSRYLFVQRHVASEMPLQVLIEHLPDYRDFLRPEAYPHFIAVTDDDSDLSAGAFLDMMAREIGPFMFHTVASEDRDGFPCRSATPTQECVLYGDMYPALCGATAPGRQYYDLADATGGEAISICRDDWDEVFNLLAQAVLDPIPVPCDIGIGERPDGVPYGQVLARVEDGETVELAEAESAGQCDPAVPAFYRVDEGVAGIALCPAVCQRLEDTMGVLILELDCHLDSDQ